MIKVNFCLKSFCFLVFPEAKTLNPSSKFHTTSVAPAMSPIQWVQFNESNSMSPTQWVQFNESGSMSPIQWVQCSVSKFIEATTTSSIQWVHFNESNESNDSISHCLGTFCNGVIVNNEQKVQSWKHKFAMRTGSYSQEFPKCWKSWEKVEKKLNGQSWKKVGKKLEEVGQRPAICQLFSHFFPTFPQLFSNFSPTCFQLSP